MALPIVRRPSARTDLLDLWSYIADDSESSADKLLDRIENVLTFLSGNPQAGRARSEISAGLRSFPVGNHIVFYPVNLF